jgi:hypothetical protein
LIIADATRKIVRLGILVEGEKIVRLDRTSLPKIRSGTVGDLISLVHSGLDDELIEGWTLGEARVQVARVDAGDSDIRDAQRTGAYPPGTSKWNQVEHRLFSSISLNGKENRW